MNIKKHIPNFLTCCNLLCGCLGIITAFYSHSYEFLATASIYIFLAGLFDFFDGFAARLLKVTSPIGKELDSLADVISFGLLPGVIIYKLIEIKLTWGASVPPLELYFLFPKEVMTWAMPLSEITDSLIHYHPYIELVSMVIPIFSALRLAKFNIDTRQTESFIGVPTPTNAILIASFPLILISQKDNFIFDLVSNPVFLIVFSIIMSLLLVAELPLFALKFKSFKWADNQIRYGFLISSVILFIFLTWTAIPIIIFLYVILSFIENKLLKPAKSLK